MANPAAMNASSSVTFLQDIFQARGVSFARIAYYADSYLFPFDVHGCRILEVGGGNGALALYIQACRKARIDVLDAYCGPGNTISNQETFLSWIERTGAMSIQIMKEDARTASIEKSSYNHIYMRNCLHHIFGKTKHSHDDITRQMSLFYDWLTPGGSLVLGEVGWMVAWRLCPPLRQLLFPGVVYASKHGFRSWLFCAEQAGFQFKGIRWYVPFRLRKISFLFANEFANMFLTGAFVLYFDKPKV